MKLIQYQPDYLPITEYQMIRIINKQKIGKDFRFTRGCLYYKKKGIKGAYPLIPTRCPKCNKLLLLDFWTQIPSIIALKCIDCDVNMDYYYKGEWVRIPKEQQDENS